MNRKQFFGNFIGLIGVAVNAKELSSLCSESPVIVKLPLYARVNDIWMDGHEKIIYFFSGKHLIPVKGEYKKINAVLSENPSDKFFLFSSSVGER